MPTVFVDTSVLVDLGKDPEMRAQLAEVLNTRRISVVIPSPAMDELLAPGDESKLQASVETLACLERGAGELLQQAKPPREIWQAELRGRLESIPLVDRLTRDQLFILLRGAAATPGTNVARFDQVRTVVKGWKAARRQDQKEAIAHFKKRLPDADVDLSRLKADLKKLRPNQLDWLISRAVPGVTPEVVARILRTPSRFPSIVAWVGLGYLAMIAEMLDKRGKGDPFFEMLQPNRNDFFDAALASPAALCDVLLTEDDALLRRFNFLSNRSFFSARARTTSQFLRQT